MTDFMDCKEEILICCCADEVGCEKEAEGEEWCGAKVDGDEELECDNS